MKQDPDSYMHKIHNFKTVPENEIKLIIREFNTMESQYQQNTFPQINNSAPDSEIWTNKTYNKLHHYMKTPICTKSDTQTAVPESFLPVIRHLWLRTASPGNMANIYKMLQKLLKGYLRVYEANITTIIAENLMTSLQAL
jgi:hypothetical protein